MPRIAYVNGRYLPLEQAAVGVEDRGYQFADGIYEVCEVRGGRLVDEDRHLARLQRSLAKLGIEQPMSILSLRVVIREVVIRNRIRNGLVYVQITRGVAPRGHAFPAKPVRPSLVVTARRSDPAAVARAEKGIAVVTYPDIRWARVDIKTVGLLPNVLAKQAAVEAGAAEAWFVDRDGLVNEGASSNAWIVTRAGALVTAPTTAQILEGVTRAVVLDTAASLGLSFEERRFSLAEALDAREAFITSATALVTPVVEIDGVAIGGGRVGETAARLRQALLRTARLAPVLTSPLAETTAIG
jgi:D-alanine transaminase